MKIRYHFNMIEVVLAIAILAIGLSSVMVLFTSGLRAQSGATEEILLSQLANEVADSIRSSKQTGATKDGWAANSNSYDEVKDYNSTNYDMSTIKKTDPFSWVFAKTSGKEWANRIYLRKAFVGYNDGKEQYEPDFSVMFNIKKVTPQIVIADQETSADTFKKSTPNANYSETYIVKMSWPADIPLDKREEQGKVRYFRVDVFNDNFDVTQ